MIEGKDSRTELSKRFDKCKKSKKASTIEKRESLNRMRIVRSRGSTLHL